MSGWNGRLGSEARRDIGKEILGALVWDLSGFLGRNSFNNRCRRWVEDGTISTHKSIKIVAVPIRWGQHRAAIHCGVHVAARRREYLCGTVFGVASCEVIQETLKSSGSDGRVLFGCKGRDESGILYIGDKGSWMRLESGQTIVEKGRAQCVAPIICQGWVGSRRIGYKIIKELGEEYNASPSSLC